MALRPNDHALTKAAIRIAYQRVADAYRLKDAIQQHSELVDLLDEEAAIVKSSSNMAQAEKIALIRDIRGRAEFHRDAVDRLTDILEARQQLTWPPSICETGTFHDF